MRLCPPPHKKPKVEEGEGSLTGYVVTEPVGDLIAGCDLGVKKGGGLNLNFYTGGGVYIHNSSEQPASLPNHWAICSFPVKGSKFAKTTDFSCDLMLAFEFTSEEDVVLFQNTPQRLAELIEKKREEDPSEAKIVYHDLEEVVLPGSRPGAFRPVKTGQIFYITGGLVPLQEDPKTTKAEEAETKLQLNSGTAGAAIPLQQWRASPTAQILFTVRWGPRGLIPTGPRLAIRPPGVTIPPSSYLRLI